MQLLRLNQRLYSLYILRHLSKLNYISFLQVHEGYGSKHSAVKRLALAGALIQAFMSDSLDAHGLGRKTIQFVQNFEDSAASGLPSVFVLKSKLSSIAAHQMSQNDLWTFYAKELLTYFEDEPNVKYLAITNVTK